MSPHGLSLACVYWCTNFVLMRVACGRPASNILLLSFVMTKMVYLIHETITHIIGSTSASESHTQIGVLWRHPDDSISCGLLSSLSSRRLERSRLASGRRLIARTCELWLLEDKRPYVASILHARLLFSSLCPPSLHARIPCAPHRQTLNLYMILYLSQTWNVGISTIQENY